MTSVIPHVDFPFYFFATSFPFISPRQLISLHALRNFRLACLLARILVSRLHKSMRWWRFKGTHLPSPLKRDESCDVKCVSSSRGAESLLRFIPPPSPAFFLGPLCFRFHTLSSPSRFYVFCFVSCACAFLRNRLVGKTHKTCQPLTSSSWSRRVITMVEQLSTSTDPDERSSDSGTAFVYPGVPCLVSSLFFSLKVVRGVELYLR